MYTYISFAKMVIREGAHWANKKNDYQPMYSILTVRHMKMKRISYLMIVFGLLIFVSAILNTKIDWVQLMFGSFLCVGGYFTFKENR